MIGIISQGRLGNQMFQFAFIYAASKALNTPFFIYGHNSLHYFKLHEELQKNNSKNILKFGTLNLLKKSSVKLSQKTVKKPVKWLKEWAIYKSIYTWNNTTDENNYLLQTYQNYTLYDGFFQSEDYFIHLKKEIENSFEIKSNIQVEFNKNKGYIFRTKTITVHIRRTDYKNFGSKALGGTNLILPIKFYKNCFSLIPNIDEYNIVFISDDIESVKNEFGIKPNYYFESNSEIIDFQLLLNANILIIANSSFSWWAAWLNQKKDKVVFAPNYFIGFKIGQFYPSGIRVNEWHWVDVF